ncbi:hypothetical protein B0H14DRAFT_3135978 [Mycena olivaceomarginata]|nr:hypothetical protein B0H14DRAFT_3135978 [Mycena olivaceomarginata]
MLLFLFLVHLFTKNGSAAPVALPLAPRSSADSCDDINNCRKLFDIVWGCLVTIFACTWVSVHPNVPPPNQSRLALFWRRLKMMLIGIIAPEIMVGFAARQYFSAQKLAKKFEFSMTHGFFFCMGGFISSTGYPVTSKEQLENPVLGPEFRETIRNVDVEDIKDKSKGDALSKAVALAQGMWFTTQCLARMHQHLVVTELEMATLAFAVVNIFIWLLWWDKPLDVQRPMVVGPAEPLDTQFTTDITIIGIPRWDISPLERFVYAIVGFEENDNQDPRAATSVPSFWSSPMVDGLQVGAIVITALAGSLFGAIHCAAWNIAFPTTAEMWIWRSCSVPFATIPVVLLLLVWLGINIEDTAFGNTMLGKIILTILTWIAGVSGPIYMVSRLVLIALPLVALRSLPSLVFVDINWSTYIPHI